MCSATRMGVTRCDGYGRSRRLRTPACRRMRGCQRACGCRRMREHPCPREFAPACARGRMPWRVWRDECGQSSVEAAFALPVIMLLLLMLLQPGIVLYDRIVMENAAAEGCRLLATTSSDQLGVCEDYVRRRLGAVPEHDLFHVHRPSCTWDVRCEGSESADEVRVFISTEVKPLPLVNMGAALAGALNEGGNMVVEVEVAMSTQPAWARSAAGGLAPSDWIESWK